MNNLYRYLESIREKQITILGIGVSNTPLMRLFLKHGISVTACDRRERDTISELADELELLGAKLQFGERYLDNIGGDIIFRTPGMRPDLPQITAAINCGAILTSEMEVFMELCPCPIFAVTGSDGKTTTTTIISEMLKKQGFIVHLGGNIGTPLLDRTDNINSSDVCVLELSSFQLMTVKHSPTRALVTNISPNHLDVHLDINEYISAKKNIFLYQKPGDILVLNAGCEHTPELLKHAQGSVLLFSRNSPPKNGVFFKDDILFYISNGQPSQIMRRADILLPGIHNVENYMAACALLHDLVSYEIMREVARTFVGVEHRQELVRVLHGVAYYNDSIASSPTRTIAGLMAFEQPIILIAGGYDKKIPFDDLGAEICSRVKLLILCGATADKIERSVLSCPTPPPIYHCDNYEQALEYAQKNADSGDIVTLSPACASFDRYPNFMVRGNEFKKLVNQLQ